MELLETLKTKITKNTAAILVEPIQGEGGVVIPPHGYLKAIETICKENNILFICDEIQAGLGRAGKLFAHQYEDVRPDMVIVGKALSGGFMPVSGVLADKEVMLTIKPGEHGSTFGGNPLACAVASKAFDIINSPETLAHVQRQSEQLKTELEKIATETGVFKHIRGVGLLIGCVLAEQYSDRANDLMEEALRQGLMVLMAGGNVLRLAPSLLLSDEDVQEGMSRLRATLAIWQG